MVPVQLAKRRAVKTVFHILKIISPYTVGTR